MLVMILSCILRFVGLLVMSLQAEEGERLGLQDVTDLENPYFRYTF